jgi:hypothetical protein
VDIYGIWDSLGIIVQVCDKGFSEPLVVMVNLEARLEVRSKANGTCLQCQSNYCDLKKIRLMQAKYTF